MILLLPADCLGVHFFVFLSSCPSFNFGPSLMHPQSNVLLEHLKSLAEDAVHPTLHGRALYEVEAHGNSNAYFLVSFSSLVQTFLEDFSLDLEIDNGLN